MFFLTESMLHTSPNLKSVLSHALLVLSVSRLQCMIRACSPVKALNFPLRSWEPRDTSRSTSASGDSRNGVFLSFHLAVPETFSYPWKTNTGLHSFLFQPLYWSLETFSKPKLPSLYGNGVGWAWKHQVACQTIDTDIYSSSSSLKFAFSNMGFHSGVSCEQSVSSSEQY